MKTILFLIFAAFLLTSCSNPDTSGGVTLSRGGDDANEFPYGSCEGQGVNELSGERTGCGWIHVNERSYYIFPDADLYKADLTDANLSDANLSGADLRLAILRDTRLWDARLWDADLSGADLFLANLWNANLRDARLRDARLRGASLTSANLSGADLEGARCCASTSGVIANSRTTCPNGKKWRTAGNDCGF